MSAILKFIHFGITHVQRPALKANEFTAKITLVTISAILVELRLVALGFLVNIVIQGIK